MKTQSRAFLFQKQTSSLVRTRSRVQIPLSAPSGTETIRCLFLRYFFYPANTNKNVLSVLRSLTKTFSDGRRHDSRIRAISIIFIVKGNLFEKLSFLSRLKSARNGTLLRQKRKAPVHPKVDGSLLH